MEKNNKIIFYSIIFLTIIVVCICTHTVLNHKTKALSDASAFRQEYMSYNDKTNEVSDNLYLDVNVSEDNTINYLKVDEAIKMLKEGTGIIYFGYPTSDLCRFLITPLLNVTKEMEEPVFYLDISDIRQEYKIKDNNIIKSKEGTKGYYELLDILNPYLENYVIDGHDTLEKRIDDALLVAVLNGKITYVYTPKSTTEDEGIVENAIVSLIKSMKTEEKCLSKGC